MNNKRIEICGGIGAGKTSFATLLSTIGFPVINESFASNPFWREFYTNPSKYAFETEIAFTLQHYHQIKKHSLADLPLVCDYSFLLDLAYAEIGLKGSELDIFKQVYQEIRRQLPPPILVVYLLCDAEVELSRIMARGREVEKSITVDFLHSLNEGIANEINRLGSDVVILTVDSSKYNFVDNQSVIISLQQLVIESLPIAASLPRLHKVPSKFNF